MKKHGFWHLLGIYCLILSLVIGIGLFILYRFLVTYEATRPETVLHTFFEKKGRDYFLENLRQTLREGYGDFSDTTADLSDFGIDENDEIVWTSSGNGEENTLLYDIKLGSVSIGTVTLIHGDATGFGMHGWYVSDCTFAPGNARNLRIELPVGASFTINGISVAEHYCTGTKTSDIAPDLSFDLAPNYAVYSIDNLRGPVDIQAFDKDGNALDPVDVSEDTIVFSAPKSHSLSFWTTANASVSVNGTDITGQYTDCIGNSFGEDALLLHYCFDALYSEPEISVTVENRPVTASSLSLGTCYIPDASAQVSEDISAFIEDFIHAYVDFAANKDRAAKANFAALQKFLIPGTDFYETCRATIENIEWATTGGLTYHDTGCYDYIPLTDGTFLCHITYHVSYTFATTKRDISADYVVRIEPCDATYRVRAMDSEL